MRVLITGASKGLGLEILRLHVKKGDYVYALVHSVTEELKEIEEKSKNIEVFTVELMMEEQIKEVLGKIDSASIDTIYNVAGIWYEDQVVSVEDTDMDKVMKLYRVNSAAPLCVMKYGKRLLKKGGMLINVSSEAGSIGENHRSADYGYCMSKAAVNMASVIFKNEVSNDNIRVYCYHPGWLRTQMGGIKAEQSPDSISAMESAEKLLSLIYGDGERPCNMFFDYNNRKWSW